MSDAEQKILGTLNQTAAQVKSLWQRWEVYMIGAVAFILGVIVGHKF